jgi:ribonuclease VapC
MIVADSSVIVAIMRHEDDADLWTDILDRTARTFMSVVAYVETGMVMTGRRLDVDPDQVEQTLQALHITVVPVTFDQGKAALTAFIRFGKGRHRAALNLADCFTYALAKSRDLPLLFKSDDFSQTDIVPAWRP